MLIPIFLVLLVFLAWRHIPTLQFQHEGAYYFKFTSFEFDSRHLTYDIFAKALFVFLAPLLKGQVFLYMWFLFAVMILIDVVFYWVVRVATGSRLTAFFAALLFALSYIGKYDMFSSGAYQYFVQRGVLLLFLLPALLFFLLYFQRNFRLGYYILGLGIYLLGIVMGFFGTWLLPIFIFYPLLFLLFNLTKGKEVLLKTIWTPVPFVIGNLKIISQNTYNPGGDEIVVWLFERTQLLFEGMMQQLAVMTLPAGVYKPLLESISKFTAMLVYNISEESFAFLTISVLVIGIYFISMLILWKLDRKRLPLAAASLLSLLAMLFFNLILNSNTIFASFESSRYFYFPSVVFAIYWGLFFSVLFLHKKRVVKLSVIAFLVFWIIHNNLVIGQEIKRDAWRHRANREALDTIKAWSPELKETPHYVWLPTTLGPYGGEFVKRFYSHPDGRFFEERVAPLKISALAQEHVDPEKLYVLHFDAARRVVVDRTEESRAELRRLQKELNE